MKKLRTCCAKSDATQGFAVCLAGREDIACRRIGWSVCEACDGWICPPPPSVRLVRRCGATLLAVVAVASALVALPAERASAQQAETLVSNLGQANGGGGSLRDFDHAQAFTTGSNPDGYTLTAVDFQFAAFQHASYPAVTVNSDSGGEPGAVVGVLTSPTHSGQISDRTYSFTHSGLHLDPDTTYWAVIAPAELLLGNNSIRNTNSAGEDTGGTAGFSIADGSLYRYNAFTSNPDRSWITFAQSKKMAVRGTAAGAKPSQNLVGNLGQAKGFDWELAQDYALAFTTGPNSAGFRLDRVDLGFTHMLASFDASPLTVGIYADSGGSPGGRLGTLTNSVFPVIDLRLQAHARPLTFTSEGNIDLEGSTAYWLVLDMSSADLHNRVGVTRSTSEDAGGLRGWSIADDILWRAVDSDPTDAWNTLERYQLMAGFRGRTLGPGLFTPDADVVFVEEGSTATVRLALNEEIASETAVITAASSDTAYFLVDHPDFLHMGRYVISCEHIEERTVQEYGRNLGTTWGTSGCRKVHDCDDPDAFDHCGPVQGRLVQTRFVEWPQDSAPVYTQPGASIDFTFDEQDWAGYVSARDPLLHPGWREVKIRSKLTGSTPGTTTPQPAVGRDRVFDLRFSSTDSSLVLPAVKVVITPGAVKYPRFSAGAIELGEGGETTYTVTNPRVPRLGETLTVTPTLAEGSGVTFDPPSVSWTSVDDYDEVRTITVRAGHDADKDDEKFVIRHEFSDPWGGGNNLGVMSGKVVDDDKLDFTLHEVGGAEIESLALYSGAGSAKSYEIRVNQPPVGCADRLYPDLCNEVLRIKAQRVTSSRWVPTDGVVTQVSFTVNGRTVTKPACEWYQPRITRLLRQRQSAGESTAGLTCEKQVVYDRAPFSLTVNGKTGYEFAHRVTPDNWDQPVRVTLAMVSDIGGTGTYYVSNSLTRYHDPSVHHTLGVNYSPTASLSVSDRTVIDGLDSPQEQDSSDQQVVKSGSADTVADAPGHTVDPAVVARVKVLAAQTHHGAAHVNRWNRVLVAFGEHDGTGVSGGAMSLAEAEDMAARHSSPVWDEVVAELTALAAAPQQTPPPPPPPTPEVNITGAVGGTEGGPVSFTVTASPAPAADMAVGVTVATSGDFGYGSVPTSVTIPASGSATITVTTTDDDADEPDGSVTLTLNAGSGYTVGALSWQTADVADDDVPSAGYTVDPDVIAKVQALAAQTQHGTAHVNRWNRVLVAFGEHDGIGVTGGAMTAADAQQMADTHSSPVWDDVAAELAALETAALRTPPPPPTPVVSITAGSGVTEGGSAT
ncbi:MAG: hypothetical protein OXH86_04160, partial [Acidimicrobiaceae bacterium]|nr:hypothetical protein [Acidimicrobiaceae bacterium]